MYVRTFHIASTICNAHTLFSCILLSTLCLTRCPQDTYTTYPLVPCTHTINAKRKGRGWKREVLSSLYVPSTLLTPYPNAHSFPFHLLLSTLCRLKDSMTRIHALLQHSASTPFARTLSASCLNNLLYLPLTLIWVPILPCSQAVQAHIPDFPLSLDLSIVTSPLGIHSYLSHTHTHTYTPCTGVYS